MTYLLKTPILLMALILLSPSIIAQIQTPQKVSEEAEVDVSNYTGILSEQYANGSPHYWKTLVNGKAEGPWLEWHPNGTLRYRAYWKNSLGHGKWEYFYPNGQLRSESFYINDIAQGIYKSYHENGQLAVDAVYLNGNKDGMEFTYDTNGLLLSRKRYENGVQVIDEPMVFEPGIISGENSNEWGINFMPDGNTAYFTRRDMATNQKRIYLTTKNENGWSKPSIAPFSTDEDEAPFINKDGSKLYFASYKPLPDGSTTQAMDMNIWVMDKINEGWSEPKPLPNIINQSMEEGSIWPAGYEAGPTTDKEGNLYFWTKGSKKNSTNLFNSSLKSDGTYSTPIELIEPSSHAHFDTAPQFSPDGKILFFGSDNRPSGFGDSDIYYSRKVNGQWSAPKNLGPIVNSYRSEGSPSFSPDGKYFFFSSNKSGRVDANGEYIWNLYYMETRFLMMD